MRFPNRARLRVLLRRALHTADSPRRTAFALALGVFLGFSPFFGVHTLLALGLAFLLRLNRLAVVGGTLVMNPWTILPIYGAGTSLGLLVWAVPPQDRPPLQIPEDGWLYPASWMESLAGLGPYVVPFFIGNLALAALAAAVTYPVSLYLVTRMRALRAARRRRRAGGPPRAVTASSPIAGQDPDRDPGEGGA